MCKHSIEDSSCVVCVLQIEEIFCPAWTKNAKLLQTDTRNYLSKTSTCIRKLDKKCCENWENLEIIYVAVISAFSKTPYYIYVRVQEADFLCVKST